MSNPTSKIKREIPSNSFSISHKTLSSNKSFTSSSSHLQDFSSKASREQEKATLIDMEKKESNVNYLIEASWIKEWALYISGSDPPGKMRTKKLLNSKGKLKKKLIFKKDYRILNKDQWYFLKSLYGADPSVKKKNKQKQIEIKKIEQTENNQDDSQSTPKNCAINLKRPSNIRSSSTVDNSFIAPKPSHARTLSEITIQKQQNVITEIIDLKPPPASAELQSGKDSLDTNTRSTMHSTPQESNSDFAFISPTDYLKKGLVGLDNPKNYCYMNAGVQLLLSIVPLRDFFYKQKLDGNEFPFTQSFINVTTSVFKLNHGSTGPVYLWRLINKFFPPGKQHDLPDFLRFYIDKLDTELTKPNILTSFIFNGMTSSRLKCKKCGNVSEKYEPFIDLQLALAPTLRQCVIQYAEEETLHYRCLSCHQDAVSCRKFILSTPPRYLLIQIKRFKSDATPIKLDSPCRFHKILDLTSFSEQKTEYKLIGIAVHIGSMSSGHYKAYCKRGRNWYCFDDSLCTKISLKEVLLQQAYVLLYKCISL